MALKNNSDLFLIGQDHLGSTATVLSSGGLPVSSTAYLPFGACRISQGTTPTDKLFTGQRLDGTGLYYYNARYYDPSIGRFISPDTTVQLAPSQPGQAIPNLTVSYSALTLLNELNGNTGVSVNVLADDGLGTSHTLNPQELNRYSYVLNNPLRYVDSTGNWGFSIALIFVAPLAIALPPVGGILLAAAIGAGIGYGLAQVKNANSNSNDKPKTSASSGSAAASNTPQGPKKPNSDYTNSDRPPWDTKGKLVKAKDPDTGNWGWKDPNGNFVFKEAGTDHWHVNMKGTSYRAPDDMSYRPDGGQNYLNLDENGMPIQH